MTSRSVTLFASSPCAADVAAFKAAAGQLIKSKLEVIIDLDPRQPISQGELAALCRGLTLSSARRAEHRLPTGEIIEVRGVYSLDETHARATKVYLGNEVRLGGRVVAQRWRSPESAAEFRDASTNEARHSKGANLFLANWRDETIIDKLLAKQMVVSLLPSDMTAGISYRISWYVREHNLAPGMVDLRPAMPALCEALDVGEADMKAEAAAAAAAAAVAMEKIQGGATAEELRVTARQLGLKGVSRLKKEDLKAAIAGSLAPARHEVTAEQMKHIAVALNLVDAEDGQPRLKHALKAAGIKVALIEGGAPGSFKAACIAAAKACVVIETAGV